MKKTAIFLLALFVLAGCATSPQSRFYHLSPMDKTAAAQAITKSAQPTISIGPVTIPDSLDRSQIVTLTGNNEMKLAEFDRWAGNLNDEIVRTLTQNLELLMPGAKVISYEMGRRVLPDYQVSMDILQFDGVRSKSVRLKANWAVTGRDRKVLLLNTADISEPVKGGSYNEMVAALSRAMAGLSSQIASALSNLH